MAKINRKMIRKSELIIPHMAKDIVSTAMTLEAALKLQIVRSNQLHKQFIWDDVSAQLEIK